MKINIGIICQQYWSDNLFWGIDILWRAAFFIAIHVTCAPQKTAIFKLDFLQYLF